jgi:hypothetical protein
LKKDGQYVFDLHHDVEYRKTLFARGYLVALFTDGCLIKKYNTPQAISIRMEELKGKSDPIDELGLAMFKECIGRPTRVLGNNSLPPVLGDDAVLVLAYQRS